MASDETRDLLDLDETAERELSDSAWIEYACSYLPASFDKTEEGLCLVSDELADFLEGVKQTIDQGGSVFERDWIAESNFEEEFLDALPDHITEHPINDKDYEETMVQTAPLIPRRVDTTGDQVVKPSHYMQYAIEPITFIMTNKLPFWMGNVVKYVLRSPFKGTEVQDLQKAIRYIEMRINEIEGRTL